jgi:hypothetical protein
MSTAFRVVILSLTVAIQIFGGVLFLLNDGPPDMIAAFFAGAVFTAMIHLKVD